MQNTIHRSIWTIFIILLVCFSCKKEEKTEYVGIVYNVGLDQPEEGLGVMLFTDDPNESVGNYTSDANGEFRYNLNKSSEKRNGKLTTNGYPYLDYKELSAIRNKEISGKIYDIFIPVFTKVGAYVNFKANDTVNPPTIVNGRYSVENVYKSIEALAQMVQPRQENNSYLFGTFLTLEAGKNHLKGFLEYESGEKLYFDTTIVVTVPVIPYDYQQIIFRF